jgi:hypothetical protein
MARINALINYHGCLYHALVLAIETSPIIAKTFISKGEYDYKLEDLETAVNKLNKINTNVLCL